MFTAFLLVCLIGTASEAQVQRTAPSLNVCQMDEFCRAKARADSIKAAELKVKLDSLTRAKIDSAAAAKKASLMVEKLDTAKKPTIALKIDTITMMVGRGKMPTVLQKIDTTMASIDTTKNAKADSVAAKKMPRLPTRHAFARDSGFKSKEALALAFLADTNGDRKRLRVTASTMIEALNRTFGLKLEHRADLVDHIRSLHEVEIPEGTELHLARLKDDGSVDYIGWKRKSHKGEVCLVNDAALCEISEWCVNPNLDPNFRLTFRTETVVDVVYAKPAEYPPVREAVARPDSQVYHGFKLLAGSIDKAAADITAAANKGSVTTVTEEVKKQDKGFLGLGFRLIGRKTDLFLGAVVVGTGIMVCRNNGCFDRVGPPTQIQRVRYIYR